MDFSNFDIQLLDKYESFVYNDLLKKGQTKNEALNTIVNSVEGCHSQLSDNLRLFVGNLKCLSYMRGFFQK